MNGIDVFHTCPPTDFQRLEEEILETVLADDNYLFYRTGMPEWDYGMKEPKKAWEVHCTACHARSFIPKNRQTKISTLTCCPMCHAKATAKRWMWRETLRTRIFWYQMKRGTGRKIWINAYGVTHDFSGEPGDEHMHFSESARYLFDDGVARKWKHNYLDYTQYTKGEWTERKSVTGESWRLNGYSHGCETYPTFMGEIPQEVIKGSCIEYSQLDRAMEHDGMDLLKYLAYYIKNPAIEYVWKLELGNWIFERFIQGKAREWERVLNMRAKTPQKLFRRLNKQEIRWAAQFGEKLCDALHYQKMRMAGVVSCDAPGWVWARAAGVSGVPTQAEDIGIQHAELRRYIERQAGRSRNGIATTLRDYGDYLRQVIELGLGEGAYFPDDLNIAHSRLSARLNTADHRLNMKFRQRRRIYSWMCFRMGGMFVRPVDSANEITLEGERMHHCVANYAKQHAGGQTAIFVLRKISAPTASWYTIEINPRTLKVIQCRAARNMRGSDEDENAKKRFLLAWAQMLESKRLERSGATRKERKTA